MENTKIQLVAVKAESVYGTDPTPTVAENLIPVVDGSFSFVPEATVLERKMSDGRLSRLPGLNVLPSATAKFRYELRGNRTNGTAADISKGAIANAVEIDCLLLAANLKATYTAESSLGAKDGYVIYTPEPKTDEGPSVTLYWWSGLKLHVLTGGKVTFSLVADAGKPVYIEFTIRGKYNAITDVALSTSGAAFLDMLPPLFVPSTATLGSYSPVFSSLKLDLGNNIILREDALSTDGVKGFLITDCRPTGELNPESVAEATNPFWANWRSQTHSTLTVAWGSATGNKLSIIAGVQLTKVDYADSNGMRVHGAQFACGRSALSSSTAELQLKFS